MKLKLIEIAPNIFSAKYIHTMSEWLMLGGLFITAIIFLATVFYFKKTIAKSKKDEDLWNIGLAYVGTIFLTLAWF